MRRRGAGDRPRATTAASCRSRSCARPAASRATAARRATSSRRPAHTAWRPRASGRSPRQLREMPMPVDRLLELQPLPRGRGLRARSASTSTIRRAARARSADEEFDRAFTGVVLTFEPGADFARGGARPSLVRALAAAARAAPARRSPSSCSPALVLVVPGLAHARLLAASSSTTSWSAGSSDWLVAAAARRWPLTARAAARPDLAAAVRACSGSGSKLALTASEPLPLARAAPAVGFFDQRYAGDVASRVQLNDRVAQLLSGRLAANVVNLTMIVFYAVVMLRYDVVADADRRRHRRCSTSSPCGSVARRRDRRQPPARAGAAASCWRTSIGGLQMIETLKAGGPSPTSSPAGPATRPRSSAPSRTLGVVDQLLSASCRRC